MGEILIEFRIIVLPGSISSSVPCGGAMPDVAWPFDAQIYVFSLRAQIHFRPRGSIPCARAVDLAAGVLVPWDHNPLVLLGHHLEKENEEPAYRWFPALPVRAAQTAYSCEREGEIRTDHRPSVGSFGARRTVDRGALAPTPVMVRPSRAA